MTNKILYSVQALAEEMNGPTVFKPSILELADYVSEFSAEGGAVLIKYVDNEPVGEIVYHRGREVSNTL